MMIVIHTKPFGTVTSLAKQSSTASRSFIDLAVSRTQQMVIKCLDQWPWDILYTYTHSFAIIITVYGYNYVFMFAYMYSLQSCINNHNFSTYILTYFAIHMYIHIQYHIQAIPLVLLAFATAILLL